MSRKNIAYLESFLAEGRNAFKAKRLGISDQLAKAEKRVWLEVSAPEYLDCLQGTLGLDVIYRR